jgi:hypothetical protein
MTFILALVGFLIEMMGLDVDFRESRSQQVQRKVVPWRRRESVVAAVNGQISMW